MSILTRLWNRIPVHPAIDEIETVAAAMSAFAIQPEPSILDKSAAHVSRFLNDARSELARLDAEIAAKEERRRQTRLAIEAFEPVLVKLDGDYSPAADAAKSYELAVDAKRNRGDRHFRKAEVAA